MTGHNFTHTRKWSTHRVPAPNREDLVSYGSRWYGMDRHCELVRSKVGCGDKICQDILDCCLDQRVVNNYRKAVVLYKAKC